jgi:Rad3-related DNA helicase
MKLKSKRYVGVRHVYDVTVRNNHNFVANGAVVHNCVNYRIARYIVDALRNPRLLLHDSTNREEMLRLHAADPGPTVLISPSMMEGVDLVGDLSRFQVLAKVPYPFLGDEVVKRRMALDQRWYAYQTARAVMQALGRSIRSADDFAVSYILDSDWGRFYDQHSGMFPDEFKSSVN